MFSLFKKSQSKLSRAPASNSKLSFSEEALEQLFRYTSGTWLYNKEQQLSQRYLKFNVDALVAEATRVSGANHCTSFTKLAEGTSNRTFLLRFDTGLELVARLPFPIAGPAHFTTASEVATMEFARTGLDLPVPAVLAWCSHASKTPVGAEYIVMEKAPGIELLQRWDNVTGKPLAELIDRLVIAEKKWAETRFSQLGSLYFADDLSQDLRSRKLYSHDVPEDAFSARFKIGPSVDRRFWRGERSQMDIDRGPWPDAEAYLRAVVACEVAWISKYAKPHRPDSPRFRAGEHNSPAAHIALLQRFERLIPYIVPTDLCDPCLWHPDMHASNLLVAEAGAPLLTGMIDWQTAVIGPLYSQSEIPSFLQHNSARFVDVEEGLKAPRLPDNFDQLDPESQEIAKRELKAASRLKYYLICSKQSNPRHTAAITFPHRNLLTLPLSCVSSTWDDGLAIFRTSMIDICDAWEEIAPPGTVCPIEFTEDEREAHMEELRGWAREQELSHLREEVGVEEDGWVKVDRYEQATKRNAELLQRELDKESSEEGKKELRRLWPFQDGVLSCTAEPCR